MNEVRPVSLNMLPFAIKCFHFDESDVFLDSPPIGSLRPVPPDMPLPFFLKWADGEPVSVKTYPDLYLAIGDYYCPKFITVKVKENFFLRKAKQLFRIPIKTKSVPNPMYKEGYFTLPDLRGIFNFPTSFSKVS